MPTYEYACTACKEPFEIVQSFADASLTECPACGGRLRKVFSPVGVVFKGSGFYKTDSRGSKNGSSGSAESKKDAPAKSESSSSSDSSSSSPASSSPAGSTPAPSGGGSSSSAAAAASSPAKPARAAS